MIPRPFLFLFLQVFYFLLWSYNKIEGFPLFKVFMHNYKYYAYLLLAMARPDKIIPLHDVKGLKTLIDEGKTQAQIAGYYGVDQATISRRIKKIKETEQK